MMWATDIASCIKQNKTNEETKIMIGTVVSTAPLTIEVSGQMISKYIYINPSFLIKSEDLNDVQTAFKDPLKIKGEIDGIVRSPKNDTEIGAVDKYIEYAFTENPIVDTDWFDFLCEFHDKYVIRKNDKIVVLQISTSFYILEKVVAV